MPASFARATGLALSLATTTNTATALATALITAAALRVRDSRVGRLHRARHLALRRGWIVVDRARDWLRVCPHPPRCP